MNLSKVISNNCIPYYMSSQSLILRNCQRLAWFFNRLRYIRNIITEKDIAPGSDVRDNTRRYYVACSLWIYSHLVKACKASLHNSI